MLSHDLTISEAFELYRLEYIVYNNQSQSTEEMSLLAMKALITHAGDITLDELTFDTVRKWKEHLQSTRSQNTTRGYIIKLRVVLAHARLRGFNALNPALIAVPKRKTTIVTFIGYTEVRKLLDCIFAPQPGYSTLNRYRNRAMVSLLYASGVRVSELCSLNQLDIREDNSFTVVGKRDNARLCFIDDRTKQCLDDYLALREDNEKALFISENTGKRVSKCTVEAVFRNASRKCGFEKPVTPHTMRHSFATNLLQNNTNLFHVRDFLGHKSTQTTEQYLHVVNKDLQEIYKNKHSY